MKILIISLPRTGSSNLLYSLGEKRNLKPIFEPFDGTNRHVYNSTDDDVIVKTIISHHENNLDLCKEFNEIILLTRKDLVACSESYAYFVKNLRKKFQSYYEYFYEDVSETEFNETYELIKKYDEEISLLSTQLNVPLTYYEDLYDPNSEDRLRKFKRMDVKKHKII